MKKPQRNKEDFIGNLSDSEKELKQAKLLIIELRNKIKALENELESKNENLETLLSYANTF